MAERLGFEPRQPFGLGSLARCWFDRSPISPYLASTTGFEPVTCALGKRRSFLLSYVEHHKFILLCCYKCLVLSAGIAPA